MLDSGIINPSKEAIRDCNNIYTWFKNFHRVMEAKRHDDAPPQMVPLELNYSQRLIMSTWLEHPRIILLKARQIGATTLAAHYFQYLMMTQGGHNIFVWSYNEDKRKEIINKVASSLDLLSPQWKKVFKVERSSAEEIILSGLGRSDGTSRIFGGSSPRGTTCTAAEFSEVGYACDRAPLAADEQRSAINAATPVPSPIIYDSTARGPRGFFKDMVVRAMEKLEAGEPFSPQEYYPIFIPWFMKPENVTDKPKGAEIPAEIKEYFELIQDKCKRVFSNKQRYWYSSELAAIGGDWNVMKREHPSTWGEAFAASRDGAFMVRSMEMAEMQGRIGHFPADPWAPCTCYLDIGYNDYTGITFHQKIDGVNRIVHYFQDRLKDPPYYASKIVEIARDKLKVQHPIIHLPHDSTQRRAEMTGTWEQQIRNVYKYAAVHVNERPKSKLGTTTLSRTFADVCQFNLEGCRTLIDALYNVSYEFDSKNMLYSNKGTLEKSEFNHAYDSYELCALNNMQTSSKLAGYQWNT